MTFTPRPYQRAMLDRIGGDSALIAADVGTGKTAVALWAAAFSSVPASALIVAPITTLPGWQRTAQELLGVDLQACTTTAAGKRAYKRLIAGDDGWFFIPWSTLVAWNKEKRVSARGASYSASVTHPLGGRRWPVVILDEVHRASRHSTLAFQVASRIRRDRTLSLSATPAGNEPVNIYGALKLTWPREYGGFRDFAGAHFRAFDNPYSDDPHSVLWGDEVSPGAVKRAAPCWVSVKARDVLADMPPVVERTVEVSMTRAQKRVYMSWEKDAIAWLKDQPVITGLPIVTRLRLRQATLGELEYEEETDTVTYSTDSRSPKIDALLEILADLPPGEPVIVWTHSQKFMTPLIHRLTKAGFKAAEISGKSKADWRDFLKGKYQILCAVPEALAEGTDGLQKVCSTEVWLSSSDNYIIGEQAKGRLVRSGQTRPVMRYWLTSPGTVDEGVAKRLAEHGISLSRSHMV